MLSGNEKYIFSRFQLYALAYVRIWTLRPYLIVLTDCKSYSAKISSLFLQVIHKVTYIIYFYSGICNLHDSVYI